MSYALPNKMCHADEYQYNQHTHMCQHVSVCFNQEINCYLASYKLLCPLNTENATTLVTTLLDYDGKCRKTKLYVHIRSQLYVRKETI